MNSDNYTITITHLYPDYMNIYGDIGNVIALKQRCMWRGYKVIVKNVSIGEALPADTDIYFIGGGQDEDQLEVNKDLIKKKDILIEQVESGVSLLSICGGFQLLGKKFFSGDKKVINGIGLMDIYTEAPSRVVSARAMGNVIAKINPAVFSINQNTWDTVVGFENHSGQTILSEGMQPFGKVIYGQGNNAHDKTEGCVYKNAIGTYLHGAFLPKNPHIADWLVERSMKRKYKSFSLTKLSDNDEIEAHKAILHRFTGVRE